MSFRYLSSISSEDDIISPRSRSLIYEDSYIDSVNHHEEYISYSQDKRRRKKNIFRISNIEQSRGDITSTSSDTDSENDIEYSQYHRSRIPRNDYSKRRSRLYHRSIDVYQSCQVIITYTNNSSLLSSKSDQILIKQKQNNDEQKILVYKGYLKNNDTFSFKSEHLSEYPFDITFYINGFIQNYFLTCCEYKYRKGNIQIGKVFLIQQIEKSIPCYKCKQRQQKQMEDISLHSSNTKKVLSDHHPSFKNDQQNNDRQSTENTNDQKEENGINDSTKSPNEGNSVNEFRQMLMEQRTNENENNGNILQSLLSLLQNGFRRKEIREPLPFREQGNVENFIVILLGISDQSNLIHSIINFVKIFDHLEEFYSFIIKLKFEKIILIINNSLFKLIKDFSQFYSIYILSNDILLENKYSNIRGQFSNLQLISEQIQEELLNEKHFLTIESVSSNDTENQSFCYSQLLKETLLKKDNEGNLKKDFIDYCQYHYQQNQIELNFIEQFQKDFTLDKSIWWFTTNSFIRKILDRCFRTQEIDILFKMRYIIQGINQQIKENPFSKVVYRIHYLSLENFEKLKEHLNGLISFGSFVDCTLNEPSNIENINQMERILFRIETKYGIETEKVRYFDSKMEVLLPLDNVYYIKSIEQNSNHYWIIHLINIDQNNKQFQQLTNEMRQHIEGPVVLIQYGKLLISNNCYLQADYLARLLFNDQSLKDNPTLLASLAALHHLLGSVDNKENNYKSARLQFEQSLKIFLTFISEDNQILSATYNNIGSMFYQEDEHDQAIIYHQKALQCQLKSSSPDIEAIATYSGNIGAVYLDQGKYDQALINYKRSLQILQQSIPNGESLSIAMVYDRIASVYWRMDKTNEALHFYQQALQLELKYLPENDHKISVSYFNLSTAYAKLNRLDDAIHSAEKSIEQLLKSVPSDHPEVKENTEQLEGLRRRKWLQQLYQ